MQLAKEFLIEKSEGMDDSITLKLLFFVFLCFFLSLASILLYSY